MYHRPLILALLAVLPLTACRDSPGPASSGAPRSIEGASADSQAAPIGTVVSEPLVARVTDERDRPVRGVEVLFTVADQMATLAPAEATTDARGEVRTTVTLGTIAGRVDVIARIAGSDSSTRFTITATPLGASRVTVVPDPMWLHAPGETGRLFGNVSDQHGNAVGASAVTWRSLDESVATVSSTGVVTAGVQLGATARIEARSAEGFVDTARVSLADPATTPCLGTTPVELAAGESVVLEPRGGTCFRSATNAEYVAVPFFASEAPNTQTDELRIIGTGLRSSPFTAFAPVAQPALRLESRPMPDDDFDARLRTREERELAPLVERARTLRLAPDVGAAHLNAIPANVAVGDVVTINASPTYACSFPSDDARRRDTRSGRVVAITQKAIVVADVANPTGGFTDDEYRQLGATFDTLVAPLDEQLFGTPGDVDGNQRSVIFYTGRVNEISTGSDSYVGGFFWSRDLLPRDVCGTSNVAEIFYMLVPDPNGELGARRTKNFVQQVTVGTLAHEYQHLINASRRAADPLADPAESTWLNEGLSHIAEEMLFYRTTGLQPRMNIGAQQFTGAVVDRYYDYQHNNVTRFERWLTSPTSNTPYGSSSSLATRGAAWAFLRYLADRHLADDGNVWFRLVNSRASGIANLEGVFGVDILEATREWAVAMYTDDLGQNLPAAFRFTSWNLRSLYPALPRSVYPIAHVDLTNNRERRLSLRGGGAGFFPFRSDAGVDARAWLTTTAGTPMPPVRVTVVRVR